jgi:hypothetical protein
VVTAIPRQFLSINNPGRYQKPFIRTTQPFPHSGVAGNGRLFFNYKHTERAIAELVICLQMKVSVVPVGPPHVVGGDVVGVNEAPPRRHGPHGGVVGVAVARDV